MVIEVKLLQEEKAELPIDVTELGIVNDPVKLPQEEKAELPIDVTELGIVNDPVKPLQP
jgi:metal-sulfur cluster biosynthetic enzyme